MKTVPNDLDAYWMPFTANRSFKAEPTMIASADGMYYTGADGRRYLDAIAGLWCCNAGHANARVVEAICRQAEKLDFVSSFGVGHAPAFRYANRLISLMPGDISHVFFSNSGSEAVDTALKIALAYHNARGDGQRQRIIGRQRGYHGMGFGGLSAAGMGPHKRQFGSLLAGAAHLPDTHDPVRNAFSRGQPKHGVERADALLDLIATYDASTIAAVVVEPVAGSTGVLVPPIGYLERLREITEKHGILLIFDEVVTGFGRLGTPFAAEKFGIVPDIITMAKGMTNGAVPMGGTAVRRHVYDMIIDKAAPGTVELSHGFTYSGHPLAIAAAEGALDAYLKDGIWDNSTAMIEPWADAIHSLRGPSQITDIRTCGLLAGIELGNSVDEGKAMVKTVVAKAMASGLMVRPVANTIVMSPPLILSKDDINHITTTLKDILYAL